MAIKYITRLGYLAHIIRLGYLAHIVNHITRVQLQQVNLAVCLRDASYRDVWDIFYLFYNLFDRGINIADFLANITRRSRRRDEYFFCHVRENIFPGACLPHETSGKTYLSFIREKTYVLNVQPPTVPQTLSFHRRFTIIFNITI